MTAFTGLRTALAAWLRWYAPSAEDCRRAPDACRPLLDAMATVNGSQVVARLADEIEREDETDPESKARLLRPDQECR